MQEEGSSAEILAGQWQEAEELEAAKAPTQKPTHFAMRKLDGATGP